MQHQPPNDCVGCVCQYATAYNNIIELQCLRCSEQLLKLLPLKFLWENGNDELQDKWQSRLKKHNAVSVETRTSRADGPLEATLMRQVVGRHISSGKHTAE